MVILWIYRKENNEKSALKILLRLKLFYAKMEALQFEEGKNMLQTIEAEIDVNGKVILLEPVRVTKRTRAIVTLLEDQEEERKGNSKKLLELLRSPEFANRKSYSAEEIEAQIEEAKNSWE